MSNAGRVNDPARRPTQPTAPAAPAAPAAATTPAQPAASAAPASAAPAASTSFTAAKPPTAAAPRQDPAAAAVAARSASRDAKYADYDKLLADGKLTVAIGVGYDETGADEVAWADIKKNLVNQGFKLDHVNKDGVHIYKQQVEMQGKMIDVTVNAFQGRNTKDPLKKFTEGMANNELVIYTGHARYGSGPDFDDINSNKENYFIGKGYTSDHKPTNLYEGANHRGIKGTDINQEYQMMLMFGCRTKDYEPEINNLLKGKNLDLVTTQDLAYWNDLPKGVDIFMRGLKAGKSQQEIMADMNSQIKGENPDQVPNLFAWKHGEDNTFKPGQAIPTKTSVDDVLAGRATISKSKDYNPLAERAQKFLMKAGIKLGTNSFAESDGRFGDKTFAAVQAFQEMKKLPKTGIIDAATMKALESYSEFA